jgi:hypothetical protein
MSTTKAFVYGFLGGVYARRADLAPIGLPTSSVCLCGCVRMAVVVVCMRLEARLQSVEACLISNAMSMSDRR